MWPTFCSAHAVCFVCRPCRRYWKTADILTAATHAEIDAVVGRTKPTGNSKEVDELESLVSRKSVGAKVEDVDEDISLALGGLELSPGPKPHAGSMDAVERWLSVEENEEVAKGIVADMVEDLCDENLVQLDLVSDDDVDEAEQGEAGQSSGAAAPPSPAYSRVAEHFGELEDTAETCGMSEVS